MGAIIGGYMLRFLTAGESHGRSLIGLIDNFPAGFEISLEKINVQMNRRRVGYGRGKRMQIENDRVTILSGLRQGITLGSPIACQIDNKDWANWKNIMDPFKPIPSRLSPREKKLAFDVTRPRPGHADLSGAIKYDTRNLRNVLERASARETAARVASGAIARQMLEHFDILIASHVVSIGKVTIGTKKFSFEELEKDSDKSPVRCLDPGKAKLMIEEIKKAKKSRDTLGGVFEVRVKNVPVGLGSNAQWFDRLDAELARAMMSIQSVKGVEIGDGFASGRKPGSKVHDRIYRDQSEKFRISKFYKRVTNNAGGIEGGMSNGCEIVVRAVCKPISTLMQPVATVDLETGEPAEAIVERSDVCVVPAAAVIGEAMAAMVIASAMTEKFGGDSRRAMEAGYSEYLQREF